MNWFQYLTIIFAKIDDWLVDLTFFGLLSPYNAKKEEVIEDEIKIKVVDQNKFSIPDSDETDNDDIDIPYNFIAPRSTDGPFLRFEITYYQATNKLIAKILDAIDLPAMDKDGKSDPYVQVELKPSDQKKQTSIKQDSLNPRFNEAFDFDLKQSDLHSKTAELVLSVWDQDFGQDDFIGSIVLPLDVMNLPRVIDETISYNCMILPPSSAGSRTKREVSFRTVARLHILMSQQYEKMNAQLKELKTSQEDVKYWRNLYLNLATEPDSEPSPSPSSPDGEGSITSTMSAPNLHFWEEDEVLNHKWKSFRSNGKSTDGTFELIKVLRDNLKGRNAKIELMKKKMDKCRCHLGEALPQNNLGTVSSKYLLR